MSPFFAWRVSSWSALACLFVFVVVVAVVVVTVAMVVGLCHWAQRAPARPSFPFVQYTYLVDPNLVVNSFAFCITND